ncbi:spondin domain-containing protein [Psychromonas sp. MME2]|uniref:spondin domain-containing protein n=1 Tax=unclassified Psychromonas TaxID=2614957 RepID=UPI00339C2986
MKNIKTHKLNYIALVVMITALSACGDNNDSDYNNDTAMQPSIYDVTLTNITQGQIFSPPALATHAVGISLWQTGSPASVALEALAEGGDASQLIALPGITQSQVSDAPVLPGETMNWTVELNANEAHGLTLATMLINTNDGFTGLTNMDLNSLTLGESYQKMLMVYDAGSEINDEVAVPGSGGEGFNASRDGDVNRVYVHAGVLTAHELAGSLLLPEHKFDNPAAKIIIKRVQ